MTEDRTAKLNTSTILQTMIPEYDWEMCPINQYNTCRVRHNHMSRRTAQSKWDILSSHSKVGLQRPLSKEKRNTKNYRAERISSDTTIKSAWQIKKWNTYMAKLNVAFIVNTHMLLVDNNICRTYSIEQATF